METFKELWAQYRWWIVGGAGALVAGFVFLLNRRGDSAQTPNVIGAPSDGETAAALTDLSGAIAGQGEAFNSAFASVAAGQASFYDALQAIMAAREPEGSIPAGQQTLTYITQTPAPAPAPTPEPVTVQSPVAESFSAVAETYGQGAPDYSTAEGQAKAALNEQHLTDPAFVQSEIDRTLKVIAYRRSQGLDTSEQAAYLQNLYSR